MEQVKNNMFLNKLIMCIVVALLFVCVFNGVVRSDKNVYAAEPTILYSGTCGTCNWSIDDTGLLRIYPTNGVSGTLSSGIYTSSWGWDGHRAFIKKVVVESGVVANSGLGSIFTNFSNCTEMDLSGLDTSNTNNFSWMFSGCSSFTDEEIQKAIAALDTSNATTMNNMFWNCKNLTRLDLSNFDTSNVTDMSYMFYECNALTELDISSFNTSKVTNMSFMFYRCKELVNLDVSHFNTSEVVDMSSMFNGCNILTELDVGDFNTGKVTSFDWMFAGCSALSSLDVSGFDTSNVKDMHYMFNNCKALSSLDVSNFDTSNVTNMSYMFNNCPLLTVLDVSNFDTSNVTNMSYMFYTCSGLLEIEVSNFNTAKTTNMKAMFGGCTKLNSLDLSSFDTSNVSDMTYMFSGCNNLTELYISNFNSINVLTMDNMFKGCSKLIRIQFGECFNFIGTSHFFDSIGDNWVKVRNANGKKTHDETIYTASQIAALNNIDSTPLLGGLWVKGYKGDDYTSNEDGTVEYVSVDSDWVFVSDNIWTYTFSVFDNSLNFNLFEEFMENYISAAMFPSYIIVVDNKAVVTNNLITAQYGKLQVTKTVEGNALTDDTFEFTIVLSGTNISGTKIYNNTVFEDGVGHFVLKTNETKTFDLPAGLNYTISEKKYPQYESVITNATGIIDKTTTAFVNVVNTYIEIPESEENCVNLTLKKTVSENCDTNKMFFISGYFTNLEPNKEYKISNGETFLSNEKGVAYVDVVLSHSNELTFHNLPVGTTYQFTEHENEYIGSVNITDFVSAPNDKIQNIENQEPNVITATMAETLAAGENILVHFHSETNPLQDLTIVKTVKEELEDGNLIDCVTDEEFEFTVTFKNIPSDTSFSSDVGKIVGDEYGEATKTFRLKNGDSVKFYDIPVGVQYTVAESPNNYVASYSIIGVNVELETNKNTTKNQTLSTQTEIVDVNEDGVVEFININANNVMSVTIRKVDVNNNLLSGAILRIVDAENNIIEEIETNGEEYIVELAVGSYILQEVSAPRGYLTADDIPFEVFAESENIITMVDEDIVTLSSTGGSGTTVTIVIAIVLGFITVVCVYVAKSKAKN